VDVLHYLTTANQDNLLGRVATSLRPGGTLIVRDVDARRTLGSIFTRLCERLGTYFNMNRVEVEFFLASVAQRCPRTPRIAVCSSVTMPGLFLDNVLLLAVRPREPQRGYV